MPQWLEATADGQQKRREAGPRNEQEEYLAAMERSPHVKRFRGGLAFKAHRLCVSLNFRLESNKEEEKMERSPSVNSE